MTRPQVSERRQRGRPPVDADDPSVPVTLSLPSKELAAYAQSAQRQRLSLQDWIRRVLQHAAAPSNKSF
jgi:predicted HicB family RNase H-like nuclease